MAESSVHELILELKLVSARFQQALGMSEGQLKAFEKQLKSVEAQAKTFKSLAISGAVFGGMGWAIAEGLKAMVEPAVEFQKAQADLQAATGASASQLEEFGRQAHAIADTLPVSAEEATAAQATLARMLGSSDAAMQTATATAQFATATHLQASEAANLLASAYNTLGNKTVPLAKGFQQMSDELAWLANRAKGGTSSGDELARSFAHVAEAARTFNVSTPQTLALLDTFNHMGLGGGRGAGTQVQELLSELYKLGKFNMPQMEKYGIFPTRDLGVMLDELRNLPLPQLKAFEKSLGTQGEALQLLIDHIQQWKEATESAAHANGLGKALADIAKQNPAAQFEIFKNVVDQLKESIGDALLPALLSITRALEPVLEGFAHLAEAHPWIAEIAGALAAVAAAGFLVIGPLLMGLAAWSELASALKLAEAAVKLFRVAMIGLNLVMDLNPIALIVAGAAALAVIGYEVWQHWSKVKELFEGAYEWGVHLVENLVKGIEAGLGKIHQAMQHVTKTIRSYLPFSPAERGPLRDLERVRIVETIAETLRPGPLMNAMRAVALAAITAPAMAQPILSPQGGASMGAITIQKIEIHVTAPLGSDAQMLGKSVEEQVVPAVERALTHIQRNARRTLWQR